jgi:hypothetical protein
MLNTFYFNPMSFEQLLVRHGVFRYNVAGRWAKMNGRDYITAKDLFCGALCSREFADLKFEASPVDYIEVPVAGIPFLKEISHLIPLQDGSSIDLNRKEFFGLHLGGRSPFDGVQTTRLYGSGGKKVLIWLDTKHGQPSTTDSLRPSEIEHLIDKLDKVEKEYPDFKHLLRIATTKTIPSVDMHLSDKRICFISNNQGRLAWSLSPTVSRLLQ